MKQKAIAPLPLHPKLNGCIFTSLTFTYYDVSKNYLVEFVF